MTETSYPVTLPPVPGGRMNPEIKALWIEKLNDPETKQTTGTLNRTADYVNPDCPERTRVAGQCCLGVLCELAADAGVVERRDEGMVGDKLIGYVYQYENTGQTITAVETGVLPHAVMTWAGLSSENPRVLDPEFGRNVPLATLNDRGRTFPSIAALIDESL